MNKTYPEKRNVAPLTEEERAWVVKLEKVLNEMPTSRMRSYTIGDSNLTFYDFEAYTEWQKDLQQMRDTSRDHEEPYHYYEMAGTVLTKIRFGFNVEGLAG